MKSIGNIYLAWRKDKDSPRILVGIIKNNATKGVRFMYLADGAIEARRLGFEAYEGFPDVTNVYTQNVLRIFGHRVLRAAVPNIEEYFDFWCINKEYKSKPYYMLAYSQGMLEDDNFEFLASFNPKKDFSLVTEITGLSETKLAADTLVEGDILKVQMASVNADDDTDVKLFKGDKMLGYVKAVHDRMFYKAKKLQVRVHKVEQDAQVNRVFIRITLPAV